MKDESMRLKQIRNRPPVMSKFIAYSAIFIVLIFAAATVAFVLSMREIIRENKGIALSRTLELERVKLETSVNNEIVIALKMASSPLVQRHFAFPYVPEIKKMALEELEAYGNAFESGIAFWVNDADRLFYYYGAEPYILDPQLPDNYWYNMTLYETESYNFNINYNPDLSVTNLWINAPVFGAGGRASGMVGTGIEISVYLEMVNRDHDGRLEVFFFNAAGEITGAKDVSLVAGKKNVEDELGAAGDNVIDFAKGLGPGETRTLDTPLGRIALGTIPLLEWYSVAVMPDSPEDYDSAMTVLFVLMLLVMAMVFVVFNVFIANLLKPLHRSMMESEMANRAKSDFLATMSHEIRTPMNSIMGFAELALDMSDIAPAQQVKDYLSKIRDNTKWLLHIINDVLDISKIESGKMELEYTHFDLLDVVMRCQSVTLPDALEKGLEMKVRAEPPRGRLLIGDPVRLYQVLINLLSNAVKFTETGTIEFSAVLRENAIRSEVPKDDGRARIYFEVKDSGIGMEAEQIDKIFTSFIQADSSTTRNYGGTGLGLSIAKNLVELMGGKLDVESVHGVGSVFRFEVSFDTAIVPDGALGTAINEDIKKPSLNGLVLVCDDNPMNREVVCEHLSRVGLHATVAENGEIAVDKVRERLEMNEKPFDLVLMDIFMPVMDGNEAASKIAALGTGVPIVAMTANVMLSDIETYKKHGMPDYLGKPFTARELWRVLLKYLPNAEPEAKSGNTGEEEPDEELIEKMRLSFNKNNHGKYDELVEAIESSDLKLAHRLAHTLKGNAGMIGKKKLQRLAAEAEAALIQALNPQAGERDDGGIAESGMRNAKIVEDSLMEALRDELALVLEELGAAEAENAPDPGCRLLSPGQLNALLEDLEHMLENINPECVNMLDDLRALPGAQELINYVEGYEFNKAMQALKELKASLNKEE